jgi:preprotein translocase SecE subunit
MAIVVNEKEPTVEEKAEIKKPLKLTEYLKEAREEFLKIVWPSKDQVTREFFVVILLVLVLTGIIFLIDKVLGIVVNFFTGRAF